jgi:hypothetical protein
MKRFTCTSLVGLVVCCVAIAAAQQAPPMPAPTTEPIEIEDRLISTRFENMRLEEVLDWIRGRVPGFNAVIVREPGVPEDYPTLPQNMELTNVTIGQFLAFLREAFANVSVKRIDGPPAPLYVIRIDAPAPGGAVIQSPAEPPLTVRVYRLKEITDALISQSQSVTTRAADEATTRTQAISHVLSVVQAALDQAGEKTQPVLKVHEPTMTLIFKGTESQQDVLEEVLRALQGRTEG